MDQDRTPRAAHDARGGDVRPVVVSYRLRVAAAWTWRLAVVVGGVAGVVYLLSVVQVLVVPLLVAALVSALLSPLVELLARHRVPRALAVLVGLVVAVAVVGGLVTLVSTQIASGFDDLADQAGAGFERLQQLLADSPVGLSSAQVDDYVAQAQEQLGASTDELLSGALAVTTTAGHVVTGAFLTLFATIFFLLDGRRIWGWLVRLLPRAAREPVDLAGHRGWVTLTQYVRATIVVATADAVGIGLGAALLGVPLAVPLGVLVFLGAFVPVVGATVSGGAAVLVALVALGPVQALIMLAVVIGVQQLESHVLQPFVLGRAVSVHPLGVILAIGAGLLLAGIAGALFAVPLVAVLNTVVHSLVGRGPDGEPESGPLAHDPPTPATATATSGRPG